MSQRTARRLTWGLVALALALLVASSVISLAGGSGVGLSGFITAIALVFAGVGALIATRHPDNAIGWIFLSVGVTAGLAEVAHAYADYWLDGNGGSEALAKAAAWYAEPLLDPVHPRARDVPPPAVPRRPPALATLAADRVVRRAGHRGRVRDAGPDPGAARGLSAADEPVRGDQPGARSAHGTVVPGHARGHRRLGGVADRQVPRARRASSASRSSGWHSRERSWR